jgi:hypothetical protein
MTKMAVWVAAAHVDMVAVVVAEAEADIGDNRGSGGGIEDSNGGNVGAGGGGDDGGP